VHLDVTGISSEFVEYHPSMHVCPETVQTADGTSQPINGIGLVRCSPSITLSSVLHVPSFLVNLLFISSLVDLLNCTVLFDKNVCIFQERKTGRKIGTGVRRDGLWYVDREAVLLAAAMNEGHEEGSGGDSKHFEQKNGSKPSRIIDFASRFILLIKSNLKFIFSIIITNLNSKLTVIKGFESPLPPMKK
jgi:hypothetical protein